jgi:hypothetical protein
MNTLMYAAPTGTTVDPMNNIANNYYTRSSGRCGGRGALLALGVVLVLAAGTAGAGLAQVDHSSSDSGAASVAWSTR